MILQRMDEAYGGLWSNTYSEDGKRNKKIR